MARFLKGYTISLIVGVEPDAPFLELENGNNEDVILEMFKDLVYDLDDVKLAAIEVEYIGE
jgi:hypothetical protein